MTRIACIRVRSTAALFLTRFTPMVLALFVLASAWFPEEATATSIGVRWTIPQSSRVVSGAFRLPGHIDIISRDLLANVHLSDATTGDLVGSMPLSFAQALHDGVPVVVDLNGDGVDEILVWTNVPSTSDYRVECFAWNGSAMIRTWVANVPGRRIHEVRFVDLATSGSLQIVVVTDAGSSHGLDVLNSATGAALFTLLPVPGPNLSISLGEWDTDPGPDILFGVHSPSGVGDYRLIGRVELGVGLKWLVSGKFGLAAPVVLPNRRDLFMDNTMGLSRLIDADTGSEIGPLPPTFVIDSTFQSVIVDVDRDDTAEVLQGSTLFDWNGSAVYQRWQASPAALGIVYETLEAEIDGNLSASEIVFRAELTLMVVDGVTGAQRFSSADFPSFLTKATQLWVADFIPGSGDGEVLAYFPSPSGLLMIGLTAPNFIRRKWQRVPGAILGVDLYRSLNHPDVLEVNLPNTQAQLYDGATGALVTIMPPQFTFSPPYLTQVVDLDSDGAPELLHRSGSGGGPNGTRLLEWDGLTFALRWQSAQVYPASATVTIEDFMDEPVSQIAFTATDRVALLRGDTGVTTYDSNGDGFTSVTAPTPGPWEDATPQSDILFEGSGPSRPVGLYLLSHTGPLAAVEEGVPTPGPGLLPPFPNPTRSGARIALTLRHADTVDLRLFDARGRLVRSLFAGPLPAGHHQFEWNGRDEYGRDAAAGVYWYRVKAAEGTATRRIVRVQ